MSALSLKRRELSGEREAGFSGKRRRQLQTPGWLTEGQKKQRPARNHVESSGGGHGESGSTNGSRGGESAGRATGAAGHVRRLHFTLMGTESGS